MESEVCDIAQKVSDFRTHAYLITILRVKMYFQLEMKQLH